MWSLFRGGHYKYAKKIFSLPTFLSTPLNANTSAMEHICIKKHKLSSPVSAHCYALHIEIGARLKYCSRLDDSKRAL